MPKQNPAHSRLTVAHKGFARLPCLTCGSVVPDGICGYRVGGLWLPLRGDTGVTGPRWESSSRPRVVVVDHNTRETTMATTATPQVSDSLHQKKERPLHT